MSEPEREETWMPKRRPPEFWKGWEAGDPPSAINIDAIVDENGHRGFGAVCNDLNRRLRRLEQDMAEIKDRRRRDATETQDSEGSV